MVSSIGSGWRSFWHTMTSNDRHASHDSPYRTGQHVPLGQSRHAPLTAVTSANDSRPDLSLEDDLKLSPPPGISTPPRPYSPGMRSITSRGLGAARRTSNDSFTTDTEIQMQSFTDGQPPPPPVAHSWEKIDRWLEEHLEELYDNLCDPATHNDVNELEHMLDCTLPTDVRESLQIHDGQERPGLPTGVIFGCMLLDCEEIVQEWNNWRRVNEEFLSTASYTPPQPPIKAFGVGPSSSSGASTPTLQSQSQSNSLWRQQLLDKQDSHPPRAVQKAYAHPSWIPLARDWGGNNIAVDLAPGPAGKWGQVIIFGRDFDCKYVVARSWASFLAMLADDFLSPHVHVDEDSGELKLKPFKQQNVEPPYMQILRWRTDQKYGRRPPSQHHQQHQQQQQQAAAAKRASAASGLGINVAGANNGKAPARDSPYGSPKGTSAEERGRSLSRFPSRGPNASPFGIASPLARVQEEPVAPEAAGASTLSPTSASTLGVDEELLDIRTPSSSKFNSSTSLTGQGEEAAAAGHATPTASSPVAAAAAASEVKNEATDSAVKEDEEEEENKAAADVKGKKADLPTPPPSTGIDHDVIEGMEKVEI